MTTTPGQSTTATPAATATTTTSGATLPGQNAPGTLSGATPGAGVAGTTTSAGAVTTTVPFTSLPQTVQAQITGQIPAGSQLAGVIQEISPQGNVTYRAQIAQAGQLREIALTPGAGAAAQNFTRAGTLTTAAQQSAGTTASGFVAAPVAFGTIPTAVQGALTTQSAGAPLSNLTFTPGINGAGMYRAMVNGRPVEVRVGPNGQILPSPTQLAVAASATSTNDLKIDDLPEATREAIKNAMPDAEVARIRRVSGTSGDLFDVTLRSGGDEKRMRISENGTVVEDNRNSALAISDANTATAVAANQPPKLAYNTLPEAVKGAITTRTDQKSIRSMFLTNYNGKTSYAVDFLDKEALRHRLLIGKDGLVVATVTNLLKIKTTDELIVVADLPAPARAAIEQQAGGKVMRVNTATSADTPAYVVTYLKDGQQQQMIVSATGERLDGEAVGAPAAAEVGQEIK